MRVRVLGCSGAIARDCRTTSFLLDPHTLIDAGTGVGDLTFEEMVRIEDVFLTHTHLDHIACLPLMLDTVAGARVRRPLRVHALPGTIAALREHVFNNVIWPDFSRLPTPQNPMLVFHPLEPGARRQVHSCVIEALPARHTVPAVGYAASSALRGSRWWVFSGDTERNPEFWRRVNQMDVAALVIETAFSNRERDLARQAMHLSPAVLADELENIDLHGSYPIYITHTKPAETETIMREVADFSHVRLSEGEDAHDIRWLSAGHVFEV